MIKLRFFLSPGASICFWCANDAAYERFGDYPVANEQLPIPMGISQQLDVLCRQFDSSIDWDYPPNPSPWTVAEQLAFDEQIERVLTLVREYLGPTFEIVDERYGDQ